jgi:small subunit ribosomal protein S15
MALTKDSKSKIITSFQKKAKDTGSSEVQIAIFTERINQLQDHFKGHVRDNHSRRGLITLVNKRRRLLDYLKKTDKERYQAIIKKLELRK